MKVIKADFSKTGKDLYYYLKELRDEYKRDYDGKIERLLTYQDLKARNRLITS